MLPGSSAVELAVFAVSAATEPDALDLATADLVVFERLPGATSSWTPSLDRCLEPGERYAWLVRGVLANENAENTDGSAKAAAWSSPRLFEISGRPSPEEVEAAIDVLLRHRETSSGGQHATENRSPRARGGSSDLLDIAREGATPPVRVAQSTTFVPRLRVEGVISGDGSELTFQGSIGSDDLGTGSVGSDEISTGAVGTSEISGSEVAVFQVATPCVGSSTLTLAPTCATPVCAAGPTTFLTCAGACTAPSQQICANTFVGLLLGS